VEKNKRVCRLGKTKNRKTPKGGGRGVSWKTDIRASRGGKRGQAARKVAAGAQEMGQGFVIRENTNKSWGELPEPRRAKGSSRRAPG